MILKTHTKKSVSFKHLHSKFQVVKNRIFTHAISTSDEAGKECNVKQGYVAGIPLLITQYFVWSNPGHSQILRSQIAQRWSFSLSPLSPHSFISLFLKSICIPFYLICFWKVGYKKIHLYFWLKKCHIFSDDINNRLIEKLTVY